MISAELYPKNPILIVDDEQSWIVSMRMLLRRKLGINNIVSCTDGRKVRELMDTQQFSLVLLDYTMPPLDAEQLLANIKPAHPNVPVVVLTGQDYLDLEQRCLELGAHSHFLKTIGTEELLNGIKKVLETA